MLKSICYIFNMNCFFMYLEKEECVVWLGVVGELPSLGQLNTHVTPACMSELRWSEHNPKTIWKQPKNNPKTIWKQSENNPKTFFSENFPRFRLQISENWLKVDNSVFAWSLENISL